MKTKLTLPFLSIILPIRNEEKYIEKTLRSVFAQTYPRKQLEILIVDGMSSDSTREIIADLAEAHPEFSLTLLDNPGRIVPCAMNIALARARGEIIVRVDGHCEIAPDYLAQCVSILMEEAVDGVGGPIETIGEDTLSTAIAFAMSSSFGVGGSAFRTIKDRTMLVDTVAFPAYTRDAIRLAGLYDEELVRNQDDEYNYRLRKLGGKILLSPEIRSRYYSRSTMRSLWKQYFQYGYWKVRVLQKHPRQMHPRQFAPPLFVAALLASGVSAFYPSLRVMALVIPGFYLLANLAASLATHGPRNGPVAGRPGMYLPLVYAILHVSYGLGFLLGLIKFASRWGDARGGVPQNPPFSGEFPG